MTMSIFPVHELDWPVQIFKPLRLGVSGKSLAKLE